MVIMRKIFLLVFVLVSFSAIGQTVQFPTTYGVGYKRTGGDSLLWIPTDTLSVPSSLSTRGHIAIKNGSQYYWNGTKWTLLSGGGGSDTATLATYFLRRKDSATITNLNGYLTRSSVTGYFTNIYNTNGNLTGNRYLYGAGGNYSLNFDSLSGFIARAQNSSYVSSIQVNPSVTVLQSDDNTGTLQSTFLNFYPDGWELYATKNTGYYAKMSASQGDTTIRLDAKKFRIGTQFTTRMYLEGAGFQRISGGGLVALAMDSTGRQVGWTSLATGSGTVTSVATNTGSGITGGTITTSGTIAADTTILSTKANVLSQLTGYVPTTRTINVTAPVTGGGALSADRTIGLDTTSGKWRSENYYNTKYQPIGSYLTGNQTITLSGDVSGSGATAITTAIGSNKVTDAMLRQSAALSVIGRSANSTGNVADISAASDGHVLRRSGTTIGFGTIDSVSVPALHTESYYNTKYQAIGGGGSGETNTASNIGGGLGIFNSKVGVDLQFKSLTASDFDTASNLISIDYTNGQAASGSNKGFLTSTDWTTFNGKQAALVSGTNIKTINGTTLLGSGDLTISGGSPAGNYGNLQINRNGAFATPASDSLGYTSGSGLVVKNGATFNSANASTGDFIVKGQTDNNLFWTDASADEVYIGGNTDFGAYKAQIRGATSGNILYLSSPDSYPYYLTLHSSSFGEVVNWRGSFKGSYIDIPLADGAFAITRGTNNLVSFSNTEVNFITNNQNTDVRIEGMTDQYLLFTDASANAVGFGASAPTAKIHIAAGTATAGTAPIKLTTGTALTTPEDGAIEYHSSHLYFTIGTTRYQLDQQSGGGLTVGTSTITSGTNTKVLYNNSGTLGEYTVSGSGNVAMTTSPVFTTPSLGAATATTINGNTFSTGTYTLTGAASKTLTFNNSLTLAGTDGTTMTFPSTTATIARTDATQTFTNSQKAANWVGGFTSTATGGTTTTLTVTSNYIQVFTGATTQTLVLPDATTLTTGHAFIVHNQSTGAITVQTNGGATLWTIAASVDAEFVCTSVGTSAGTWEVQYVALNTATGKSLTVNNTLTMSGTDGTTMTFPTTTATIARTDAAQTFTGVQTFSSAPVFSTNTVTANGNTMTFPASAATLARTDAAQTFTGSQTFSQVLTTNNAITASGNAATVPVTSAISTVTNNSAATLTITLTTASAIDGQRVTVRVLDFSAVAQSIVWVNTENSSIAAPTTSNGSTSLFLTVVFIYNSATSKWRCIGYA